MARRGARVLDEEPGRGPPKGTDRAARPDAARSRWAPEEWVEEAPPRPAPAQRRAAPSRSGGRARLPEAVAGELRAAAGPDKAAALEPRLAEAIRAYERDRYRDALRILKELATAAPQAAGVRELHGLTLYRMGRWAAAIKELEAYRAMTGSFEQHPVLADCHRALGHWEAVAALWDELRRASPSAEVVAEGRIVAAGALADRGDVAGAIRLLAQGPTSRKSPRLHHLRLWYALADLHERAGDIPRARELFLTVARHAPDFVDVDRRLAALG